MDKAENLASPPTRHPSRSPDPEYAVRITHVGLVSYPPGSQFGPRRMEEFELIWVLEGGARYHYQADTDPHPLLECPAHFLIEGSVALCRPHTRDTFVWHSHLGVRHAYVHFQLESELPGWPEIINWPTVVEGSADGVLIALFKHVLQLSQALEPLTLSSECRPALERRLNVALNHLLHEFVWETPLSPLRETSRWPERVRGMLRLIQAHLERDPQTKLGVGDLARMLHLTPAHLSRLVRASTGHTPQTCVRLARLDHSLGLLAETTLTIGQIADRCGFAHPFHFSRCFKAVFGVSPQAQRRALERGEALPLPRLKSWGMAQDFHDSVPNR